MQRSIKNQYIMEARNVTNQRKEEMMADTKEKFVRFDWAMKKLLRNKANYAVLAGLITTLLGEKVTIRKLLESESNKDRENDKQNRVDLLAESENGELYLIEVQNESEVAYFQRMLFGTSKLVTEYIERGKGYDDIRKIYSINIVYFNIGQGTDIVYHGKTEFRGIHNGELLSLSPFQKQKYKVSEVSKLYPEYYILKVNDFNRWSKVPLEQWIYTLSTGDIPEDADAPGLPEAREALKLSRMSKAELDAYYHHLDNLVILKDNIITARWEAEQEGLAKGMEEGLAKGMEEGMAKGMEKGLEEGMAKGLAKGMAKEKINNARNLKENGVPIDVIVKSLGLSAEEIEKL